MATFRRFPSPQKGRPWENIPEKGEGGMPLPPPDLDRGVFWAGPGVWWVESEHSPSRSVGPARGGAGSVGRRGP